MLWLVFSMLHRNFHLVYQIFFYNIFLSLSQSEKTTIFYISRNISHFFKKTTPRTWLWFYEKHKKKKQKQKYVFHLKNIRKKKLETNKTNIIYYSCVFYVYVEGNIWIFFNFILKKNIIHLEVMPQVINFFFVSKKQRWKTFSSILGLNNLWIIQIICRSF